MLGPTGIGVLWARRELQEKIMKIGLGPAKAKDFNTGIGPWLVTPDEIGNPGTHACISALTRCTLGLRWYQP